MRTEQDLMPTLPEYLEAKQGCTWTAQDSEWVRAHVQQIERLAEDLIQRAEREDPVKRLRLTGWRRRRVAYLAAKLAAQMEAK